MPFVGVDYCGKKIAEDKFNYYDPHNPCLRSCERISRLLLLDLIIANFCTDFIDKQLKNFVDYAKCFIKGIMTNIFFNSIKFLPFFCRGGGGRVILSRDSFRRVKVPSHKI